MFLFCPTSLLVLAFSFIARRVRPSLALVDNEVDVWFYVLSHCLLTTNLSHSTTVGSTCEMRKNPGSCLTLPRIELTTQPSEGFVCTCKFPPKDIYVPDRKIHRISRSLLFTTYTGGMVEMRTKSSMREGVRSFEVYRVLSLIYQKPIGRVVLMSPEISERRGCRVTREKAAQPVCA